jgi:hypothetical protein
LYFDTTSDSMKVYSGSAWLDAYATLSGALIATNNLSDLNNVSTARTQPPKALQPTMHYLSLVVL